MNVDLSRTSKGERCVFLSCVTEIPISTSDIAPDAMRSSFVCYVTLVMKATFEPFVRRNRQTELNRGSKLADLRASDVCLCACQNRRYRTTSMLSTG
jgi:hypothetical protein